MSDRAEYDDFLGWAPDLGLWDAPPAPQAVTAPHPRVAAAPTPPPSQAPARRSGAPAHPPTQNSTPPHARPNRRPASKLRVPVLVAAAVMLVFTFFAALIMATSSTQSSPVMLGLFGVLTALLGRVAWGLRHR